MRLRGGGEVAEFTFERPLPCGDTEKQTSDKHELQLQHLVGQKAGPHFVVDVIKKEFCG